MGIQEITTIGPSITDQDISVFEKVIGGRLPSTYRRFLLEHNGGRPEPSSTKNIAFSEFYGLKTKKKYCDLLAVYRVMRERLPKEMMSIGDSAFGDQICLVIKGKNRGKLYFWDHEGRPENVDIRAKYPGIIFDEDDPDNSKPRAPVTDDWPGEPDLVLIADSFTEFLDDFHEFVPDEPKVKRKRPK
ncbi:MAG: SMI1/KNR4 family protein [Nitrospira sp.]|nr:SMI1/KNR4 family protein [Nitrospira sp.]